MQTKYLNMSKYGKQLEYLFTHRKQAAPHIFFFIFITKFLRNVIEKPSIKWSAQ